MGGAILPHISTARLVGPGEALQTTMEEMTIAEEETVLQEGATQIDDLLAETLDEHQTDHEEDQGGQDHLAHLDPQVDLSYRHHLLDNPRVAGTTQIRSLLV